MHTEQDTFDRLKRMPFEQMRLIVREMNRNGRSLSVPKAIKDNGWNIIDYRLKLAMTIIQGELSNNTALLPPGNSRVMYE